MINTKVRVTQRSGIRHDRYIPTYEGIVMWVQLNQHNYQLLVNVDGQLMMVSSVESMIIPLS